MKSRLDLIENTIKSLFESETVIFSWGDDQSVLLHKILESIQEYLENFEGETKEMPARFTIYLSSHDHRVIERKENYNIAVENFISEIGAELGFSWTKKPTIEMITRNSLASGEIVVKTIATPALLGETNAVPVELKNFTREVDKGACTGYLIMEDESLFELIKPVTNIGRNSTNHLMLNDLRVSRTHAQIRAVGDEFIIFDIGSSGGTYINGERISQRKLKPGDVISLAGIKLIFTVEQPETSESSQGIPKETKPMNSTEEPPC